MTLPDLLFTEHLPSLDLHGLDVMSAKVMIKDFISDNRKLKNEFLVIIHGIGTGALRKATGDALKIDKNVISYKVSNFNSGCTIVKIKN